MRGNLGNERGSWAPSGWGLPPPSPPHPHSLEWPEGAAASGTSGAVRGTVPRLLDVYKVCSGGAKFCRTNKIAQRNVQTCTTHAPNMCTSRRAKGAAARAFNTILCTFVAHFSEQVLCNPGLGFRSDRWSGLALGSAAGGAAAGLSPGLACYTGRQTQLL